MDLSPVVEVITAVVTVASLASNWVAPWTIAGRVLHWLACNGPAIQEAARTVRPKKTGKNPAKESAPEEAAP